MAICSYVHTLVHTTIQVQNCNVFIYLCNKHRDKGIIYRKNRKLIHAKRTTGNF